MMYSTSKVSDLTQIEEIVRKTFTGDTSLFETYHFINNNEEAAIADTLANITSIMNEADAEFYQFECDGKVIGYINTIQRQNLLYSFGVNKSYRNDDVKRCFVETIDSMFDKDYMVYLYSKNTRAINFMCNNGFEEQEVRLLTKKKKK